MPARVLDPAYAGCLDPTERHRVYSVRTTTVLCLRLTSDRCELGTSGILSSRQPNRVTSVQIAFKPIPHQLQTHVCHWAAVRSHAVLDTVNNNSNQAKTVNNKRISVSSFFFYDWQKYYIFEAVAREQFALWRNYIGDKIGEIRLSPRDFELFAGCISYSICHEKREREKVQPTENKRTHKLSSGFHRQEMTDRANSSDLEIYWTTDVSNMLRLRGASMQTLRL